MDPQLDVLVIFHTITASPSKGGAGYIQPNQDQHTEETGNDAGPIVEIDWCAFDLRKHLVIDEAQYFVSPAPNYKITPEFTENTGITQEEIETGLNLSEVLKKFNEKCFFEFIQKNLSFCLLSFGDDLLTKNLPFQVKDLNLKLQQHFYTYFDLLYEFRKFYPQTDGVNSVTSMLSYLQLRNIPINHLGQLECKNMVRIVNKLVKDSHRFMNPKILNHKFEIISGNQEILPTRRNNYKKWSAYIRGRSPEPFKNPTKQFVVRLRGLPYQAREYEVMDFLRGLRARKENISFLYDVDGKFTGEAFVKLLNSGDYYEALSFHNGDMQDRYIEVYESSEDDWNRAFNSQFPDKREYYFSSNDMQTVSKEVGIIKMMGLPLAATEKDITNFFAGFKISENGIKRSIRNGRPSGQAFVLFESHEEAENALGKNDMEKIGTKPIELSKSSAREYENFLSHNFINAAPAYSKDNMPNIPLEKRKNTLLVTGLPFDISKQELIAFFNEFNVVKDEVHMINNHNEKFSGNALLVFEDEMEAQKAMKIKNLTYIRNRYIELAEYR